MRLAMLSVIIGALTYAIADADERSEPRQPQPVNWSADMQAVADGNNLFALDLYARLRTGPTNVFYSPFSVHSALAMTADGANGATRDQMIKVLHLPVDREKGLATGDVGRFYTRPSRPYELAIANSLWGQKGFSWRPEFLARQKSRFGTGLEETDFAADPNVARQRINTWAADKTRGKIPVVVDANDITPLTRMVLANAIYFKSDWRWKFHTTSTKDAPFHLPDGGQVTAPLMHQESEFRYADGDGFQVLEMQYKGGDLAMVVVLPAKPDRLPDVEKRLTSDAITKWLVAGKERPVRVWLPRFRLETAFSLGDALGELGMTAAFDAQTADFSGMARERVALTRVVHRAFVDVNEEGTEAAAVTGIFGNAPSPVPPEPVDFRADRPFLFQIRDVKHGTILFMGRVRNPKG